MSDKDILGTIISFQEHGSPQQIKIAVHVLENIEKVAMYSVTQLAREIGVSQPTLTRFSQALGFKRYQEFQSAFQSLLLAELNTVDRLALNADERLLNHEGSIKIIAREIKVLSEFSQNFPRQAFDQVVTRICQAKRVCVLGVRGAAIMAQHLSHYLRKVKRNIITITNGSSLSYDQLIHLNQKDVVIATSFYRYGTETIEMVKFCRDHGVSVIAITDDSASPIAAAANIKIFLPVAYGAIFDSHCSVYCFFNMMATQICRMNKPEAAELFEKHEQVAKRFDVYAEVSRRKFGESRLS